MAVDTRNKRSSVQAYTFGLMRPLADGAATEPDRATLAWLYSGIDYDSAAAAIANAVRRMRRSVFRGLLQLGGR